MRILAFPSDLAGLIDKKPFVDWFDLVVDQQELSSIGTGRLQKLIDKARLMKSNIFEYRSRLVSHTHSKVLQNVYYKIAIDEKDLRNQFLVAIHMSS